MGQTILFMDLPVVSKESLLEITLLQLSDCCFQAEVSGCVEKEAAIEDFAFSSRSRARKEATNEVTRLAASGEAIAAVLHVEKILGCAHAPPLLAAAIWQLRVAQQCSEEDSAAVSESLRSGLFPLVTQSQHDAGAEAVFEDMAALSLFCPVFRAARTCAEPRPGGTSSETAIGALGMPPRLSRLLSGEHRAQVLRSLSDELELGYSDSRTHGHRSGKTCAESDMQAKPQLRLPTLLEATLMLGQASGASGAAQQR